MSKTVYSYVAQEKEVMVQYLTTLNPDEKITLKKCKEFADLFNATIWEERPVRKAKNILFWLGKYRRNHGKGPRGVTYQKTSLQHELPIPTETKQTEAPGADEFCVLMNGLISRARVLSSAATALYEEAKRVKAAYESEKQSLRSYAKIREIVEKDLPNLLTRR